MNYCYKSTKRRMTRYEISNYRYNGQVMAGVVQDDRFYSFRSVNKELPGDMLPFIDGYDRLKPLVEETDLTAITPTCSTAKPLFLAPLPDPRSMRGLHGL